MPDSFRRRKVTELLGVLYAAIKHPSPSVLISAAVVADVNIAYQHRLQDWREWTEGNLLDALCPMAYSTDLKAYKHQVATARGFSFGTRVWAGIGAWQIAAPETVLRIQMARKIETDGFILFSYNSLIAESAVNPAGNNLMKIGLFLTEETRDTLTSLFQRHAHQSPRVSSTVEPE